MQVDLEVDALGLLCPLPVLKARKRLTPGQVLSLLADDPAAVVDVPHFCREAGHDLISAEGDGRVRRYLIRKG
jgi:tRNA 2-thiouridine synthesizing protein A